MKRLHRDCRANPNNDLAVQGLEKVPNSDCIRSDNRINIRKIKQVFKKRKIPEQNM